MTDNLEFDCIDESSIKKLKEAGFDDDEEIATASPKKLTSVLDIDETTTTNIIEQAQKRALEGVGFESATDVEPSADFTGLNVSEEIYGWNLFIHDRSRIGWESPAGYRLIIEGHQSRIWGSLPHEDQEKPYEITTEQNLRPKMSSPEDAVAWAENWMIERAINPEINLPKYTGISDKLAEHLQIVYAINSEEELRQFLYEDSEQLQKIIGPQHFPQLKKELESDTETN